MRCYVAQCAELVGRNLKITVEKQVISVVGRDFHSRVLLDRIWQLLCVIDCGELRSVVRDGAFAHCPLNHLVKDLRITQVFREQRRLSVNLEAFLQRL